MVRITVNGEARETDAPSVEALLSALSLPKERVAVERNGTLVPRARRADTAVVDGDVFEIVTLVGGG
jgi:thiamine biosynthesis protein ThiS